MIFRQFLDKASSAASTFISKSTHQASRPRPRISTMFSESGHYRPQILVIGGAYGGLSAVTNLINLIAGNPQLPSPVQPSPIGLERKLQIRPRITILDERDGIFHTMGAPLAHTSKDFTSEAWIAYKDIKHLTNGDVKVLQGRVVNVDMASKIASYMEIPAHDEVNSSQKLGSTTDQSLQISSADPVLATKLVPYDYLVVATGIQRAWPIVPKSLTKKHYVHDAEKHIRKLSDANHIAVVGGGAVGVELAAEIKHEFPEKHVMLIHSRSKLLSAEPLPDEFQEKAAMILTEMGVDVHLNQRVMNTADFEARSGDTNRKLVLSDGQQLICDEMIYATGAQVPKSNILPTETWNETGHINVRRTLQLSSTLPQADTHFAVGDVVSWSGIKRVGNAFIMGQFAATNIVRMLLNSEQSNNDTPGYRPLELEECPDFEPMMALSIGQNAVVYKEGASVTSGVHLKDAIVGRGLGIDLCSKYLSLDDLKA